MARLSSVESPSRARDGPVGSVRPGRGAVAGADDRRRRVEVGRVVDWDSMKN